MNQPESAVHSLQQEYDRLYQQAPIRDEDRAYRWHAQTVQRYQPTAQTLLDIACGGGYFLREYLKLRPSSVDLHGTDLSGEALAIAKKECPEGRYVMACAEKLPYRDQYFDAVTCLGSLEHFLDIPAAVSEMKRVARDQAVFYILVPNLFWYKDMVSVILTGGRLTRNQTHERFHSRKEWEEILTSAGLKIQTVLKYNGIAKQPAKQSLKDLLIPLNISYHFAFICRK